MASNLYAYSLPVDSKTNLVVTPHKGGEVEVGFQGKDGSDNHSVSLLSHQVESLRDMLFHATSQRPKP